MGHAQNPAGAVQTLLHLGLPGGCDRPERPTMEGIRRANNVCTFCTQTIMTVFARNFQGRFVGLCAAVAKE